MTFKLGVIGAEASKFTEETELQAKDNIREILEQAKAQHPDLVFVSGRCPIAICEACGKLKFAAPEEPLEGYFTCRLCGSPKAKRMGGIDVAAEAEARKQGIPCDIKVPAFNRWGDLKTYGFQSRNINIAKDSDELYVIVVKEYPFGFTGEDRGDCFHCARAGRPVNHKTSGACWSSTKFTEFHNKPATYIII